MRSQTSECFLTYLHRAKVKCSSSAKFEEGEATSTEKFLLCTILRKMAFLRGAPFLHVLPNITLKCCLTNMWVRTITYYKCIIT